MSEINVDTIKNAAGTREFFPCTAWVNFDGTGTVVINASGNVSSITDNGVGDYTANFTTLMANVDYGVVVSAENTTGYQVGMLQSGGKSTTSIRVLTGTPHTGANVDSPNVSVSIHGGIS